jgi:two-component system, chemotaxis family, sensor kinase CheA
MVLNTADLMQSVEAVGLRSQIESEAEKVRVLLVEDSVPIRTQMKRILEGAGYDVTAAVDGSDGLSKFREAAFDAIVSDVEMPNLTGLELTRKVREVPEYDAVPIILVTTLAKEEDQLRGADAGANAYLTKGNFDQSLLLNTLRGLV